MSQQEKFSKRIFDLLAASGYTQTELARYLGLKSQTISHWISGRSTPTFDRLEAIARYFHLSVSELLGDIDPDESPSPSIIFHSVSDDLTQIPYGSEVRVELRTAPEVGDIVLYQSEGAERLLRLAAYKDGISVLMSDRPGDPPVIASDSEREIVGTATAILLKKTKKETASTAIDTASTAMDNGMNSSELYHDLGEVSTWQLENTGGCLALSVVPLCRN